MAMKKTFYKVTCYKDTGFNNGVDIPYSQAVLMSAPKIEYSESYYVREDLTLPIIKVNDSYHNLSDVDYVCLTETESPYTKYFYFCTPIAEAGSTCSLSLELDALTTIGVNNINYSGWQVRGHIRKEDDILFGNNATESFVPLKPLQMSDVKTIGKEYELAPISFRNYTKPTEDLHIVVSSVDLVAASDIDPELQERIEAYGCFLKDDPDDPVMYIPKVKNNDIEVSTEFGMFTPNVNGYNTLNSSKLPGICAFDYDNSKIRKAVEALNSIGQLQLIASFTIPKDALIKSYTYGAVHYDGIEYERDEEYGFMTGRLLKLTGICEYADITDKPFEYTEENYTPKNKKCYSMFRSMTVANVSSGSQITKPIYELKFGNNINPKICVFSDPMCTTGKPFAKFMTDYSKLDFADVVLGSCWLNNQIILDGASNSVWNNANYAITQQGNDITFRQFNYNTQVGFANNFANSILALTSQAYEKQNLKNSNFDQGLAGLNSALSLLGDAKNVREVIQDGVSGIGSTISSFRHSTTQKAYIDMLDTINSLKNMRNEIDRKNIVANLGFGLDMLSLGDKSNMLGQIQNVQLIANAPLFMPTLNLAIYGRNNFVIYEQRMELSDLKELDRYFQRYGYNGLHKELTKECFNTREYFTYIVCEDVNIKPINGSFSRVIKAKAISQLLNGVRVWKCLPDFDKIDLN